ncbi:uncharacterized protein TrAFT101_008477 [Trichoderma asperellum]|uniref:uncharacterized protein n=1 Tax=Trichoderma asperellum TaxID=101201 RepID=UPI00333054F6|nr:hypothetical protein TrAFT101_008477 [Trichoderma asperellum]
MSTGKIPATGHASKFQSQRNISQHTGITKLSKQLPITIYQKEKKKVRPGKKRESEKRKNKKCRVGSRTSVSLTQGNANTPLSQRANSALTPAADFSLCLTIRPPRSWRTSY